MEPEALTIWLNADGTIAGKPARAWADAEARRIAPLWGSAWVEEQVDVVGRPWIRLVAAGYTGPVYREPAPLDLDRLHRQLDRPGRRIPRVYRTPEPA